MFNVNRYLIMKRRNFARLYFFSNDELMDMVANAGDAIKLQTDIHKLFPGIYKLNFQQNPNLLKIEEKLARAKEKLSKKLN
jgi:hypothetical protein